MIRYLVFLLLLTSIPLKAQVINGPINTPFQSPLNNEKLLINFNSTFLLVGESLLFNVQCRDAITNTLSALSKIVYIEIIDEESRPILQTRIELVDGIGSGDFFLPSILGTGNYTVVAYTSWMRNFPVEGFFNKVITIINPFKRPTYQVSNLKQGLNIEFFPEGGNIIRGITNTIGFLINQNSKLNTPYTVRIIDDLGTLVTESTSTREGTGIISLLPMPDRTYKVSIDGNQYSFFKDLPTPKEEGIAIRTVTTREFIDVNLSYRGLENNISATVAVLHQGTFVYKALVKFVSDTVHLQIKNNLLPSGFSKVVVFNDASVVTNERTIFIMPNPMKQLTIELGTTEFKHREKVSLRVKLNDSVRSSSLAVSVRRIENKLTDFNITDNTINNNVSDKELDLLCLIDRRKEWDYNTLTSQKLQTPKYLPEIRGVIIKGTVKNQTGTPMANDLVYLTIPSSNYLFIASKTDSLGNFYFITDKIKYNTEIILQVSPENKNNYKINIESEFHDEYHQFTPPSLSIDSSFAELIKERSIFSQLENVYFSEKVDSIISKPEMRFYRQPDKVYRLDDYVRFPTMDDVFIEYIPEISLRKKGDLYNIKVVNFKTGTAFLEDPLILLDGIPVSDHNQVISLNPLLIKKIEIIKRRYFYGPLDVSGIISIESYKGDGMGISLKDDTLKEMVGTQPQKVYYQPNHGVENPSRIPDFRIQLYWDPVLKIERGQSKLIEFYTSDVNGDFEITIEGTDLNGNRISGKEIISVKQP